MDVVRACSKKRFKQRLRSGTGMDPRRKEKKRKTKNNMAKDDGEGKRQRRMANMGTN